MPTMSAVAYSRETASCSWKSALCYTTAVQRLQRQRLCQQTPHFKAVATIVGSNREERSCLWVPEANWSLRRKNRIQKNLTEKQWEKNPAHLYGTKARSSRNSPSCFHIQSIFSLAHMEWASANFLLQTFLFLSLERSKAANSKSHSYEQEPPGLHGQSHHAIFLTQQTADKLRHTSKYIHTYVLSAQQMWGDVTWAQTPHDRQKIWRCKFLKNANERKEI